MHRRPGVAAAGVIHLALPRDGGGAYYNAVSKNMNVKPEKKPQSQLQGHNRKKFLVQMPIIFTP